MSRPRVSTLALVTLAALAAPLGADTLVTKDGRIVEVEKARETDGVYRLEFSCGEIVCPPEHVASVEIEGDMSEYEPKDEREREYLEKGFVRFEGRWISKPAYENELAKRAEARRTRTAELAAHADFANGWTTETKHFVVRTNTTPELLDYYAELMEAYYRLMDDVIGIKPTPTLRRTKMTVNVYRTQQEMIEHATAEDVDESLLGYFWSGDHSLNFFHEFKDPARSTMVALHECTHLLTYLIDQDYLSQIWINEGVADYFGAADVKRDGKKIELVPGRLQTEDLLTVREAMANGEHVPLAQLFLVTDDEFDAFEYAHAWSFVYFLQNTPRYARNFNRFFKDLYTLNLKGVKIETLAAGWDDKTGSRKRYTPEDIRDALVDRLNADVHTLEREWREFVNAIEVDGVDARFRRGRRDALRFGGEPEAVLADLQAAIDGGIADPQAYWARGYVRVRQGDWDSAVADFRRAVEMAPLDPTYRADLGWALSGWWGGADGEVIGTPEELAEAATQFCLAAALAPDEPLYARLHEEYGAAWSKHRSE